LFDGYRADDSFRHEMEQASRLFSTPDIKISEFLKVLYTLNFRIALSYFQHYLTIREKMGAMNYHEWLASFTSTTPLALSLVVALLESARRNESIDKTLLKSFFQLMEKCKDSYLHDMVLKRVSEICLDLLNPVETVPVFVSRFKSPLASWYTAIIISQNVNFRKQEEILRMRKRLSPGGLRHFDEGVKMWICGLYENERISLNDFLSRTNGKNYVDFCN
jgi:hypothetical protein